MIENDCVITYFVELMDKFITLCLAFYFLDIIIMKWKKMFFLMWVLNKHIHESIDTTYLLH